MTRIVVGMSGGVDSAVAAYLLRQEGYEVIGITLRTWEGEGSRCCEINKARETAEHLGIPYHVVNCVSDFKRKIEIPFADSYLRGFTPNPCIVCNAEIKWRWMRYAANAYHAEKTATGHYVSIIRKPSGSFRIRQGKDEARDQSYMLYRLSQEQLANTVFPLGDLTKKEVRDIAVRAGIPAADVSDSQEICFITRGKYTDYIKDHMGERVPGVGNFVDSEGRILGRHRGIIHYTVGQRKGLGIAMGYPIYVKRICVETNEVVLGREEELLKSEICCANVFFCDDREVPEDGKIRVKVKIRYHDRGTDAWLKRCRNGMAFIRFDEKVRAPAPGQAAVFYDRKQCVLGGGIIQPENPQSQNLCL